MLKGDSIHITVNSAQITIPLKKGFRKKTFVKVEQAGQGCCLMKTSKSSMKLDRDSTQESSSDDSDTQTSPRSLENIGKTYTWNQHVVTPVIPYNTSKIKFWISIYQAKTFSKDSLLGETSLTIDEETASVLVNHEQSFTLQLVSDRTQESTNPQKRLTRSSHSKSAPNVLQLSSSIGDVHISVRIERDEDTAIRAHLESLRTSHVISMENWKTDPLSLIPVGTAVTDVSNSKPEQCDKITLGKKVSVFLPENQWVLKQYSNTDKKTIRGTIFSKRSLGNDTEILSVTYKAGLEKTKEGFDNCKNLLESMILHAIQTDAMGPIEVKIKSQDVSSHFSCFDNAFLYAYSFNNRRGVPIDYLVYILKPRGLNVILSLALETSFGVNQEDYEFIENVARTSIIVFNDI